MCNPSVCKKVCDGHIVSLLVFSFLFLYNYGFYLEVVLFYIYNFCDMVEKGLFFSRKRGGQLSASGS